MWYAIGSFYATHPNWCIQFQNQFCTVRKEITKTATFRKAGLRMGNPLYCCTKRISIIISTLLPTVSIQEIVETVSNPLLSVILVISGSRWHCNPCCVCLLSFLGRDRNSCPTPLSPASMPYAVVVVVVEPYSGQNPIVTPGLLGMRPRHLSCDRRLIKILASRPTIYLRLTD